MNWLLRALRLTLVDGTLGEGLVDDRRERFYTSNGRPTLMHSLHDWSMAALIIGSDPGQM